MDSVIRHRQGLGAGWDGSLIRVLTGSLIRIDYRGGCGE